jgi:antitoxin MazE
MEARIKIKKWGNDLGINIPPVIATGLSLKEGLYVSIHENGSKIIIDPAATQPNVEYILAEMLSEITENNVHHCIETGMPIGNEVW